MSLRSGNGKPEIWNVDDGSVENITHYTRTNKRLKTTLPLEPFASRFIVIRREGQAPDYVNKQSTLLHDYYVNQHDVSLDLDQPWEVEFSEALAGPGTVTFDTLIDWKNSPLSSVKHYSGTAKYTNHFFIAPSKRTSDQPLYLDLGDVQQIAEVSVNGEHIATLWKPPFVVDISEVIESGENTLEIDVTNTWVNRLIGDEALPDTSGYSMTGDTVPWIVENSPPPKSERVTFTGFNFFGKQPKELQSSGLLGPVKIIKAKKD